MKRVNKKNDPYKNVFRVAKRIAITILCCIPVMAIFAYLTRNIIKSDALQVLCFMFIMGIAVAIVEVVAREREKQKEEIIETKRDVFK